jgi:hypothetical protein
MCIYTMSTHSIYLVSDLEAAITAIPLTGLIDDSCKFTV